MVVQSIALPKVSGSEHELAVSAPARVEAAVAGGRSFQGTVLIPLLVVAQGAWLALLGYAAVRVLG
jgi:hypothetical protein